MVVKDKQFLYIGQTTIAEEKWVITGEGYLYDFKGNLVYEGQLQNGKKQGKGVYYTNNNCCVTANFDKNKAHGKATILYENGDFFEGYLEKALMHGKGKYYFKKTGNRFEGLWVDGKKEGPSNLYFSNGDKLEVSYINDKKEGYGIIYNEEGAVIFRGYYSNDHKNGLGTEFYDNGLVMFEGEFKDGSKHYGKSNYKTGMVMYEGQFVNNYPSGKGVEYYENGSVRYKGNFNDSNWHDYGTKYLQNGNKEYSGIFCNNLLEEYCLSKEEKEKGYKTMLDKTGKIYVGEVNKKNQKHGFGKLIYLDEGNLGYEGSWKHDRKHGLGNSFYGLNSEDQKNTIKYKGPYKHGHKVKSKGKFYDKNTGKIIMAPKKRNNEESGILINNISEMPSEILESTTIHSQFDLLKGNMSFNSSFQDYTLETDGQGNSSNKKHVKLPCMLGNYKKSTSIEKTKRNTNHKIMSRTADNSFRNHSNEFITKSNDKSYSNNKLNETSNNNPKKFGS